MHTVIKTNLSVIQANRNASLYPVNFNTTQVTLNNTQIFCLQLALANGPKQNDMHIEKTAVCGLHSTLGRNVILPPVRRMESAVLRF